MIEIENILDVEKYIDDSDVIIFDLDDTLYSEKDYVRSGYKAIGTAYPNIIDFSNRLWNAFLEGKQAIDYVLEQENLLSEKDNCLKIYRFHKPEIALYQGVYEMLNRIKKNKKIGVITDGRPEGQRAKLESLGLINEKFIITDELGGVQYRKPCEKAFMIMKDYFSCDYERMIYIGDNVKKDFIAPNRLGMKTIWFINKEGLYK